MITIIGRGPIYRNSYEKYPLLLNFKPLPGRFYFIDKLCLLNVQIRKVKFKMSKIKINEAIYSGLQYHQDLSILPHWQSSKLVLKSDTA